MNEIKYIAAALRITPEFANEIKDSLDEKHDHGVSDGDFDMILGVTYAEFVAAADAAFEDGICASDVCGVRTCFVYEPSDHDYFDSSLSISFVGKGGKPLASTSKGDPIMFNIGRREYDCDVCDYIVEMARMMTAQCFSRDAWFVGWIDGHEEAKEVLQIEAKGEGFAEALIGVGDRI